MSAPGPARRFERGVTEVKFTARQMQALRAMSAHTNQSKPALIRQAVELLLVAEGFLEPITNNEGVQQ